MKFTLNALLNSNNQIRTNRRYPNPIQTITQTAHSRYTSYVQTHTRMNAMRKSGLNFNENQIDRIRKCLHSKSPECRNFFLQIPLETLVQLHSHQTFMIKRALESNSPEAKNFFSQTPPETLVNFDDWAMFAIMNGLESNNPEIKNFFLQNLETLVQCDGQIAHTIMEGLESNSPESRNFFSQTPIETLLQFNVLQMSAIQSGLESTNPECKNLFLQTPLETLVQFNGYQMSSITRGLESNNPECRNFFSQNTPEILAQFNGHQMSEIRFGLERNNPECRNFFLQTPIEVLAQFNHFQIYHMVEAFTGNDPQLLNQINADRDTARQNYFASAQGSGVSREKLEDNIRNLYAPVINHIIDYTQRALETFDITPQEAYRKKIDSSRFNVLRNVQLASAAAKGANISMIPNETLGKIAEYRGGDPNDFIVDKSSLATARAMYNRIFLNNDNH